MNKRRIEKCGRVLSLCLGLIPALTLAAPVQPVEVSSNSDTLFAGQIQQFFQQQYASSGMQVTTVVTTPAARQPQCLSPQFSLSQNARSWGNVSVAVNCNGQKSYVQAKVQVSGTYWVAARNVASGAHLSAADMQQKSGRLDLLPPRAILESQQALNAVTMRNINIGQPLTLSMLRRPWMVHAGQQVQVQATGSGFNVSSAGKAMNNAAAAETVRVRMPSGQIVNGTVGADGTVSIAI
ncbi:flagellar basal body P-ring formation chaperone FlgA [Ewingella americana]|uniref:Flagella basal body P-ring formation protein FlgA n=1 Tax=Ewingella americana TaxID=41202 RepID=A0A502GUZ6_9GAMM|nr:flagellar basal body P-ring formation chaperone FlgA [Ewingella americana]TPG64803.1 flagellar basal body P-ring formation protein FlgA [Ewingella americana]